MTETLVEKLMLVLGAYCKDQGDGAFNIVVEPCKVDEVRAVLHAEHFNRMENRQRPVWDYLRANLKPEELMHVATIQTLGLGEEALPWRD